MLPRSSSWFKDPFLFCNNGLFLLPPLLLIIILEFKLRCLKPLLRRYKSICSFRLETPWRGRVWKPTMLWSICDCHVTWSLWSIRDPLRHARARAYNACLLPVRLAGHAHIFNGALISMYLLLSTLTCTSMKIYPLIRKYINGPGSTSRYGFINKLLLSLIISAS